MHVTLHLTTGCNMACDYCYSPPVMRNDMTSETAFGSIDFIAAHYPVNTGIIFFGGEPLLKKGLIRDTIEYANTISKKSGAYFHYKVSTNGTLLDRDFLEYARKTGLQVSLSIDGNEQAHNTHRKYSDGRPNFNDVAPKAGLLLEFQPYAKALMTVSPETLPHYADSFEYLMGRGFKYIIVSLNYAGDWEQAHLKELKKQYEKISRLYEKYIMDERKFYFSPFEMKFASHIRQDNIECYQCHLAKNQISIAHTGDIYPCTQFVKDRDFK